MRAFLRGAVILMESVWLTYGTITLGYALEAGSGTPGAISVELNKLEQESEACRAYFVVDNGIAEAIQELQLDVFIFDTKGVILRRIALTFPDVRARKTKVAIFDLAELPCTDIGRFLVNDVIICSVEAGRTLEGCADGLSVTSRAAPKFEY
jgi:hypothetical protein